MRGGRGERAKLSRVSLRSSYVLSHILTPTITHHYSPYLPYLPALPPLLHSSFTPPHVVFHTPAAPPCSLLAMTRGRSFSGRTVSAPPSGGTHTRRASSVSR